MSVLRGGVVHIEWWGTSNYGRLGAPTSLVCEVVNGRWAPLYAVPQSSLRVPSPVTCLACLASEAS